MILKIKPARQADIPVLAEMNHQLIADEGSRNPMTVEQLAERMRGWLENGWTALLVVMDERVVGYMLYQARTDEYFPDQKQVYIRQFFISRDKRGKGIGRQAFEMIVDGWLPDEVPLTLEVLSHNITAMNFWEKMGFTAYSIAMRR